MGKKVNVMLYDTDKGIFETEFGTDGQTVYAREYNAGGLMITDDKGTILANFEPIEWLAYAVEKTEEDEDGEEEE